ncbi:unnamed protein product [Polarella glacialis]|uniref:FHA domain-containing protein n=1 Tax=Polarella glacialis TaxID=89957 RepID=A0A813ES26_POLGL|nr:unnamed protein product [Polarella glacialis]
MLGRLHQTQFELLLKAAAQPNLLSFISRSHVQVEVRGQTGLQVKNMSSNPLYVDQVPVPTGEVRLIAPGQLLSFARLDAGSHVHFLKFRLLSTGATAVVNAQSADSGQASDLRRSSGAGLSVAPPPRLPPGDIAAPSGGSPERRARALRPHLRGTTEQHEPDEALSPSPPARLVSKDRSSSPSKLRPPHPSANPPDPKLGQEEAATLNEGVGEGAKVPVAGSWSGVSTNRGTDNSGTMVVLELSGNGVLDVPAQDRRIGPVSLANKPLFVGRKHQPDLHRHAVSQEYLQFVSRDHFRISWESGEFKLLAMTSNPIWRDRDGGPPIELGRGDVVTLLRGDRIALGSGSDSSLPEDALRSLCWKFSWERIGGQEEVDAQACSWGRTPPSPGGRGPRVFSDDFEPGPIAQSQDFDGTGPKAKARSQRP